MTVRIEVSNGPAGKPRQARAKLPAMLRGFLRRCPACGQGPLFAGYLETAAHCASCQEELHHQRADDAPAYFTITLAGHIIIPLVVAAELAWQWPYWLHAAVWLPFTLGLTFWLMPRVKGAVIGLQWALRMHGFGSSGDGGDSQYIDRRSDP